MKFLKQLKSLKISARKRTVILALLTMISLTAVLSVRPIYAYLYMITETPASNTLRHSPSVAPTVDVAEDYVIHVGDTRTNPSDRDDKGYSVYVRAAVVFTWRNSEGNVHAIHPVVSVASGSNWKFNNNDGFYYYKVPVKSEGYTTALITGCTADGSAPEAGYELYVEVIAQTIQSEPKTAVISSWGVDPTTL